MGVVATLHQSTCCMSKCLTSSNDSASNLVPTAVQAYLERPELNPDTVKKASKAAYGLCCWVRAMEAYDRCGVQWLSTDCVRVLEHEQLAAIKRLVCTTQLHQLNCRVAKVIAPKRAALAQAEMEYAALRQGLDVKKAELTHIVAALEALEVKLAAMQERKKALEDGVLTCQRKIERAAKLISGLGGEKTRWGDTAQALAADAHNATGDILIAAGYIAYLGPFTAAFRERATSQWLQHYRWNCLHRRAG